MDEEKIVIGIHRIENKGLYYTMSMVQGRYRVPILYCLSLNGPMRYNELKRMIDPVTFRSLALTLKSLEDDGLIIRKDYNQKPPRVEYYLSEKGESMVPLLNNFVEWGEDNIG